LVIYMGLSNLAGIVRGLRDAGMPAVMPVAVVQNGTLATQRSVVSTLDAVIGEVARARLASPALVVVGEVVKFAARTAVDVAERHVAA
jgi:siroheme synthase